GRPGQGAARPVDDRHAQDPRVPFVSPYIELFRRLAASRPGPDPSTAVVLEDVLEARVGGEAVRHPEPGAGGQRPPPRLGEERRDRHIRRGRGIVPDPRPPGPSVAHGVIRAEPEGARVLEVEEEGSSGARAKSSPVPGENRSGTNRYATVGWMKIPERRLSYPTNRPSKPSAAGE